MIEKPEVRNLSQEMEKLTITEELPTSSEHIPLLQPSKIKERSDQIMEEPPITNIIPTIEVAIPIEERSTVNKKGDLTHQVISPTAIPKYLRQIDKSKQTSMCAYCWGPFQLKPCLRKG